MDKIKFVNLYNLSDLLHIHLVEYTEIKCINTKETTCNFGT